MGQSRVFLMKQNLYLAFMALLKCEGASPTAAVMCRSQKRKGGMLVPVRFLPFPINIKQCERAQKALRFTSFIVATSGQICFMYMRNTSLERKKTSSRSLSSETQTAFMGTSSPPETFRLRRTPVLKSTSVGTCPGKPELIRQSKHQTSARPFHWC